MDTDTVVLVDSLDKVLGFEDKMQVHKGHGLLHRAISALVMRRNDGVVETLLQKRSADKLLWPSFWTNTVCTHPTKNETYEHAVIRRLKEEMGISVLISACYAGFRMEYQVQYSETLAEHELDTVVFCTWSGDPSANPKEVSEWKWISWDTMKHDMKLHPDHYTPWFHLIVSNPKTKEIIKSL